MKKGRCTLNIPSALRKIPLPNADELTAIAMLMYSLPSVVHRVDALAVPNTGLGEDQRVTQVFRDWHDPKTQARYCFVAGQHPLEKFSMYQTVESLSQKFGVTKHDGLIVQPQADHTRHQAEWVREQIELTGATSVAVYGPHYHLPRVWLTFVQEIVFRAGIRIPVVPVQVIMSPFDFMEEYLPEEVAKWELIAGELQRIRKYSLKGDVANFDNAFVYIKWLWEHPMFQS